MKNEWTDEYIIKSEAFARPILSHLRLLVHEAFPDIIESKKWSFPNFEHKGLVCNMASFKEHCTFGFWKAALLKDPEKILTATGESAMGHLGKIKNLTDLPSDNILIAYIREAVQLNIDLVKSPVKTRSEKKELVIPAYFIESLEGVSIAKNFFDQLSYSNKKEYIEWFTEAKTEETRFKRIETALEWLSEGKTRNWKYIKK